MESPTLPLIKSKNYLKEEKDCVKIKLFRDPTLEMPDMYEFSIVLFDNYKPEEFLLFVKNSKMNLNASGIITDDYNLWYLLNILHGEALSQFDTFCDQV